MKTQNEIAQVLERMLPVGSIVEWAPVEGDNTDLSTPEKVAAYYGFGTWEAYGSGRMLLGVSGSHAIGSTGGEETHRHGIWEACAYMRLNDNNTIDTIDGGSYTIYGNTNAWRGTRKVDVSGHTYMETDAQDRAVAVTGITTTDTVMPPYITVYRWRRIK